MPFMRATCEYTRPARRPVNAVQIAIVGAQAYEAGCLEERVELDFCVCATGEDEISVEGRGAY